MSPRRASRTQDCTDSDARRRLADARAQLDLAELASATSGAEEKKAAAACAVLAGIDAADAACCKALGRRSRSQDHRDAVALVRQVEPGGATRRSTSSDCLVSRIRPSTGSRTAAASD